MDLDNGSTAQGMAGTGGTPWGRRVAWLLLAAVVLYYVAMAGLNMAGYFDYREFAVTDTSTYRYIGRRMAEGALLYTDVWDIKGPLIYLTYYWGYLLSGGAAWGVEAAILLYSLLATWCGYRAFRRIAEPLPAAAGVVLMSATVGFIGWCGTTGESTYTLLALIGLALTLPAHGDGGRHGWRWCVAGALVALCMLCKANYVGFGCFLLVYWGMRGRFWKAAATSAAGFSLALAGVALAMWCKGNLEDMLDASVWFNLHEYHAEAPGWATFGSLPAPAAKELELLCAEFQYAKHFLNAYTWMALLLAGSCAVLWWRRKDGAHPRGLVPALLAWVVAEFLTGGVKFLIYDHYYETLFLPVCMLAVVAAASARTGWGRGAALLAILGAAAATSGPWFYFRPVSPDAPVALQEVDATARKQNPQAKPVAVIGGADVLLTLNRLGMHSNQRYAHCALMLGYDLSPKRRQELLRELEAALEQAAADGTFLLAEEPLPVLTERHPELAPLLRGWRAVDESPQNRVFLYMPPGKERE